MNPAAYLAKLEAEKFQYEDREDVHLLPPIFHYWTEKHLRPKCEAFGFSDPVGFFAKYLRPGRIASIGAGNCDLEAGLAKHLLAQGHRDFVVDCFDLNPAMLARGAAQGIEQIRCVEADLNQWSPEEKYDFVIANQSLHHLVNLEGLFDAIQQCLQPDGKFLVSDIIGRNGHLRSPEALEIVQKFWAKLPPSYKFHHTLLRYEEEFQDWDCSQDGFEGIRAQDILPLLRERFHFELFLPYGNLIDPFIDRGFGPNFDPQREWDRTFLDAVHARDEAELAAGRLQPTHLIAVLCKQPATPMTALSRELGPVEIPPNPRTAEEELRIACERLTEVGTRLRHQMKQGDDLYCELMERTAWVERLQSELQQKTEWAKSLEAQMFEMREWAGDLEAQLDERTAWALQLEPELEARKEQVQRLEAELIRRTQWAQGLERDLAEARRLYHEKERELAERTAWALALERELNPPGSNNPPS